MDVKHHFRVHRHSGAKGDRCAGMDVLGTDVFELGDVGADPVLSKRHRFVMFVRCQLWRGGAADALPAVVVWVQISRKLPIMHPLTRAAGSRCSSRLALLAVGRSFGNPTCLRRLLTIKNRLCESEKTLGWAPLIGLQKGCRGFCLVWLRVLVGDRLGAEAVGSQGIHEQVPIFDVVLCRLPPRYVVARYALTRWDEEDAIRNLKCQRSWRKSGVLSSKV